MNGVTVFRTLGPIDGRNLRRDSMLRWLLFAPPALALAFRWLLPWVTDWALRQFGFDIEPLYPLIYGFLVLMCPSLYGVVIGFLLLDERDDGTITALQVTPLTLNNYVWYRISLPMILSIVLLPPLLWLAGLRGVSLGQMLLTAVTTSPLAPFYMLLLAAFAPNKVQGFALMKAAGILWFFPLLAWFVAMPWQLLFGIFPLYWPVKVLWTAVANEPGIILYALLGLLTQMIMVYALLRRFNRIMRQS